MSKRVVSALSIAIFSLAMCRAHAQSATKPCELTQQDYDVFAGLLQELGKPEHPEEASQGKEMLIVDTTATQQPEKQDKAFESYSNSESSRSVEAFRDYLNKVHDSCAVKPQFGGSQSYRIIAGKEIHDLFSKTVGKGWEEFYKKYPNSSGYWQFSRPGLNLAHDTAWLYVAHVCDWLCGTGHLYLLSKEDGRWTVKYRLMLWIS
jgi:hypothetical protein